MKHRADLAAVALIAIAILRIASTWTVFSATVDEPMHIAAGLQLVKDGQYTLHPLNPPLPRAILGAAPAFGGMTVDPKGDVAQQLTRVFHTGHGYMRNLMLARVGNLVFFLIAAVATWLWARHELGPIGGLVAALLFTTQPMILGHSSLATLDVAMTAGVALSLLMFSRWMDQPGWRRAIAFGAAYGFAIACKLPCALYVPAACIAMALIRRPRRAHTLVAALATAIVATIVFYGFRVEWLLLALRESVAADRTLTFSYLFGEVSTKGWWWYFPAAIALKTTLASLILAGASVITKHRAPIAAAVAILIVAMPTPLDVGVRYVLPAYVPLTVAAAAFALRARVIGIVLLAWHLAASAIAHPDYLPYFNELAVRRPWLYLIDSNLDWGQDVLRLREVVREKNIPRLGVKILGWHDFDALRFPPHYEVHRTIPTQGWVAVSEHFYTISGGWDWLRGRRYERVGKSIRLYYIP